jgi:hypothetical protein
MVNADELQVGAGMMPVPRAREARRRRYGERDPDRSGQAARATIGFDGRFAWKAGLLFSNIGGMRAGGTATVLEPRALADPPRGR